MSFLSEDEEALAKRELAEIGAIVCFWSVALPIVVAAIMI